MAITFFKIKIKQKIIRFCSKVFEFILKNLCRKLRMFPLNPSTFEDPVSPKKNGKSDMLTTSNKAIIPEQITVINTNKIHCLGKKGINFLIISFQ